MPVRCVLSALLSWILPLCVLSSQELLTNPGFESGVTGWLSDGFTMETDAVVKHGGVASVKCTGRTKQFQGPSQMVPLSQGKQYVFTAYLRLQNDLPGHLYQMVAVKVRLDFTDGTHKMVPIGQVRFFSTASGWVTIGGDFVTPHREIRQAKLHIDSLSPHISFNLDDASLTELPDDVTWEQKADQRIENLRKSNIHVRVTVPSGRDPSDYTVQLKHVKHSFAWGSVVKPDWLIDQRFTQYTEVVGDMFNWATIQDYKWRYDRGNQTNPDFDVAVQATDVLNNMGLKVRGHCMFWAVNGKNPDWVDKLSGPELRQAVDERIAYMTNITKGKLAHWDVNNELVHGHYYEQHTGDVAYTEHMFRAIHQADPAPTLFLNDFAAVARGTSTQSYLSQILRLKAANVSLGGVGIQSHYIEYQEPNPEVINDRLDQLASAGVPLWITELDMTANDENTKADWLERVMRLYFAHPAVHGIILWGFWDRDMQEPDRALVEGYNFQLRESGKRYMKLTKETWSTHVNTSLATGTSFDLRGFQGDYEATIWYKGMPVQMSKFTLGKDDQTVDITVSSSQNPIFLPPHKEIFNVVGSSHPDVSSESLKALGSSSCTSTSRLRCTTRRSRVSAVGNNEMVTAHCQGEEILTGCSSIHKGFDWHRKGEQILIEHGIPVCKAINSYLSTSGVQAVARCCTMTHLSCSYWTAGPSHSSVDDAVKVPCPQNTLATGCSAFSNHGTLDGASYSNTSCLAQNDDPKNGVYSYAVCCGNNDLECQTVVSAPSGHNHSDTAHVTCPDDYVMMGCNVYSPFGRAAGASAIIAGPDICQAVNGDDKTAGEVGVQAQARCCKQKSLTRTGSARNGPAKSGGPARSGSDRNGGPARSSWTRNAGRGL